MTEPISSHEYGRRLRQLKERLLVSSPHHDYTSTACWHGIHEECRRTCKFCGGLCACSCHPRLQWEGSSGHD